MKKLITTIVAVSAGLVSAQTNNWVNSTDTPWKNSSEQCWRNSSWTPATTHPDCDCAIKPVPRIQATFTAPVVAPTPVATLPAPQPQASKIVKLTYATDTLFDFDKSVLKPEGRLVLDGLVGKINKEFILEVIIAVGHTDSIGSDSYNMNLGRRRAEAVKAYLVTRGIEKTRVYTDSKGERQPIADNKTAAGRAKNRRVEIEVVGTSK
jgi:OOP family OmpA-OmpF porin